MCGIIGYIGERSLKEVLYNGLVKLEYRGYDSAGISVLSKSQKESDNNTITTFKATGKLHHLGEEIENKNIVGHMGIGHTRWATHGVPSTENSHPHNSTDNKISIVHNGIIENHAELRANLIKKGYKFSSATDTEVIAHLLDENYTGDLAETLWNTLPLLEGTYALACITANEPDVLVCARKGSPLVVGIGKDDNKNKENFVASDVSAILEYTDQVIFLDDNELVSIKKDQVSIWDDHKKIKHVVPTTIDWTIETAEKNGYDHFTLKEIHEQPKVISDTLKGKIKNNSGIINHMNLTDEELRNISKIHIVACGTSYHAGLTGKYMIESELRIPVEVEVASEFRYKNPIISSHDLVILISQSGETADTLAGLREAKKHGAKTIGIINVVGSNISREADGTISTNAGLEVGVASTKAFTTQLIALYVLTLFLGEKKSILTVERRAYIIENLNKLPSMVTEILKMESLIAEKVSIFNNAISSIFIGRNINTAIAREGSLKLKEISYIHAEAYPSGELKHGSLALISDVCPLVAIATKSSTYDKVKSNIEEVKARGGKILTLATQGDKEIANISAEVIYLPEIDELFSPIINVIPLQMLAYHTATARNLDVDKPRNLAKSVTVE